jgi:probable HAF family extracellular repeat protein
MIRTNDDVVSRGSLRKRHDRFGFFAGLNNTVAGGISADGTTITVTALNGTPTQAGYWTEATGMVALGYFLGGSQSSAIAVNANGSVIVGSGLASSGNYHAFRWTQATGLQDLGTLPGGTHSTASVVSADGTIVGGAAADASNRSFAFRWTDATGMQKLVDLLTARVLLSQRTGQPVC